MVNNKHQQEKDNKMNYNASAMYDKYLDSHPHNPANAKDAVWTDGYICPNQFEGEFLDAVEAYDRASIDNWMPILNAEVNAQLIADKFGIAVTVTIRDEGDWSREEAVFNPKVQGV